MSRSDLAQGLVYTCVGAAAIFLNVLGAIVYAKRGFHKPTNRAMFCVTLSDIGGGLVGLYTGIYLLFAHKCWFDAWYLDDMLCGMWPMLWLFCNIGTTLLVPIISIMRLIAVSFPLKFHLVTNPRVMVSLWMSLVYSTAAAVYPLYPGTGFFKIPTSAMCIFDNMQAGLVISKMYAWLFNFLPTLTSVTITVLANSAILYILIQKSLKKKKKEKPKRGITVHTNKITDIVGPDESAETNASTAIITTIPKKKVFSGQSKTIVSLATVFLICYAQKLLIYTMLILNPRRPYHQLLDDFFNSEGVSVFFTISDYCITINSFLNPIIYVLYSSQVRAEFRQVCTAGHETRGTGGRNTSSNGVRAVSVV